MGFRSQALPCWVYSNLVMKDGRGQKFVRFNSRSSETISGRISRKARPFDVFINHSGMDTKRNVAALLHDRLVQLNLYPFLDYKTMNPGDELKETIESAIRDCKVGVTIFSPHYCFSKNCLHELALMMEWDKKVIPIFYDVKPSDLVLVDDGTYPANQRHRYSLALQLAKGTFGISFDSSQGDWSDLLKRTSDGVVEMLKEQKAEVNK